MRRVLFIVGPTASEKTALSLPVAEQLRGEIISADSRQLYRQLRIGAAQPSETELTRVPHHFVGCLEIGEHFSAGEFGRRGRAKIAELLERGITPIVVGGSGLYVSALADDFFSGPDADPDLRSRLQAIAAKQGISALYQQLQAIDSEAAQKILPNDYRRIERALEIYQLTGVPISRLRRQQANPPPYQPVMVGLNWARAELYERINRRCSQMLANGLVEEVKSLLVQVHAMGVEILNKNNALNSVGYAEVIRYLFQEFDYAEMVRLFQRNTRRFAKRQMAWFKRDQRIQWIAINTDSTATALAAQILQRFSTAPE